MLMLLLVPNLFMKKSIQSSWYKCIRPSITPPNYIFPIVWTLLYLCIGFEFAETLILPSTFFRNILLGLYIWNFSLNMLWSFMYFVWHDVAMSLFVIGNIMLTTAFIIYYTYIVHPEYMCYLLLPYFVWISFATVLNFLSMRKTDC